MILNALGDFYNSGSYILQGNSGAAAASISGEGLLTNEGKFIREGGGSKNVVVSTLFDNTGGEIIAEGAAVEFSGGGALNGGFWTLDDGQVSYTLGEQFLVQGKPKARGTGTFILNAGDFRLESGAQLTSPGSSVDFLDLAMSA